MGQMGGVEDCDKLFDVGEGFRNEFNTCYLNSVLQLFRRCRLLFSKHELCRHDCEICFMLKELHELFGDSSRIGIFINLLQKRLKVNLRKMTNPREFFVRFLNYVLSDKRHDHLLKTIMLKGLESIPASMSGTGKVLTRNFENYIFDLNRNNKLPIKDQIVLLQQENTRLPWYLVSEFPRYLFITLLLLPKSGLREEFDFIDCNEQRSYKYKMIGCNVGGGHAISFISYPSSSPGWVCFNDDSKYNCNFGHVIGNLRRVNSVLSMFVFERAGPKEGKSFKLGRKESNLIRMNQNPVVEVRVGGLFVKKRMRCICQREYDIRAQESTVVLCPFCKVGFDVVKREFALKKKKKRMVSKKVRSNSLPKVPKLRNTGIFTIKY